MSIKTTHQPGDPIKAVDMNSVNELAILNAHNIFELFLENFFSAKVTPFNGLFFDGFSDTTKADISATTLTAQAASGQAILTVGDTSAFSTDRPNISIFDATNREEKIIQSVDSGTQLTLTTNLANTFESGSDVQRSDVNFDTGGKLINFSAPPASTVADQSQSSFAVIVRSVSGQGNDEAGAVQTFVPSVSGNITKITCRISDPDGGSDAFVKFEIQSVDGGGVPTGTSLGSMGAASTGSEATLTGTGSVPVTAGTRVALAVLSDSSNSFDIKGNTGNPFTGGKLFSTDDNVTFAEIVDKDIAFEIFISTPAKKQNYFSKLQEFQQTMASVRLWVVRNFTAQFNLASGISAGATTLTITGDETGKFASGNTIDISTSDNLTRERKTLTATPSFSGGVTTLTFSATTNAFTTSDFVERVDVNPEISLVNKGNPESFESLTFVRSIVDFSNSEVEDEYSFEPSTPNEDLTINLELTREDTSLEPFAKRLGIVLIE